MTFRPISSPLAGEHVLAVEPRPAFPSVDAGWRRRTRMFTGRSLDAEALSREQDARGGQLALLGQTLSPGVVFGLEAVLESTAQGDFVRVSPGIGLVASGEDVVLGRELRVAFEALLPAPATAAPLAAVLALTPVVRWVRGRFDRTDPCQRDEDDDAYADERWIDGVELVLMPWLPAWGALTKASVQRNPLAYRVFEAERTLGAGEVAPWQVGAVPIALVGLAGRRVAWLDRGAMVRSGGHAPGRTPLASTPRLRAGSRALWQARIAQLLEQVEQAVLGGPVPTAASLGLRWLPPAGVLPRSVMDVTTLSNRFFPPTWRLRAAPIPREQLDGVLARAAALAPLSTTVGEEILVLVPVPQSVYEPGLLELDPHPDALFQQEIDRLAGERNGWLQRRLYLRNRRDAVRAAIDRALEVADPDPDPSRLENEAAVTENGIGEDTFEVVNEGGTLRPRAVVDLKRRLDAPSLGGAALLTAGERAVLYSEGLVSFIAKLEKKLKQADDLIDFGFLKAQTTIYRLRQFMLDNTYATRLATSPVLATIAKGATSGVVREDLKILFANMKSAAPVETGGGGGVVRDVGLELAGESEAPAAEAGRYLRRDTPSMVTAEREELEVSAAGIKRVTTERDAIVAVTGAGGSSLSGVRETADIIGGGGDDIRHVTVAERMAAPASVEVRDTAKAGNYDNVRGLKELADLGLNLDDIPIYGIAEGEGRVKKSFKDLEDADFTNMLGNPKPKANDPKDEAALFYDAASVLEGNVATLRGIETRVAQYREVIRDCKALVLTLRATEAKVLARMAVVADELNDSRRELAMARALLAEELARLARIASRRKAVLDQHVREVGFVRPRYFDGLTTVPTMSLDPALLQSPLPGCLTGHDDAPAELDELVGLLREAPLGWLIHARAALDFLDRVELLHRLMATARLRVQSMAQLGFNAPWSVHQPPGLLGRTLAALGQAQVDAVWQLRAPIADFDLGRLLGIGWVESRNTAHEVVSLGDLIEGSHGKSRAAASAIAELERINKVAACLWARVGEVEPVIRLTWAEALSQYEPGRSLRSLSALPRWRDIDFRLRKDIEVLAEWLMDRVDPRRPEAIAWMLDLVRTAILLASHAPVDEIIAGHVPAAAPAHPGAMVAVAMDPARVRIGMHVTFFHGGIAISRGVVEDLVGDRARARIVESVRDDLRIEPEVRVQFTSQVRLLT